MNNKKGLCRACGLELFKNPMLSFKNMPSVAQHLPDKSTLKKDRGINLDIFMCSGCGLTQLDATPVPYFREVIRAVGFSEEMVNFRQKQFAKFVNKYGLKNKKIIEVGCGHGEFLSLIKNAGADAYGIEYGPKAVKTCVKNNLKVTKGFVDSKNYKIPHAPFDAFFMMSFFEHLPQPQVALRGIYNNLKDGAVGIIEVPNFNMMLKDKLFSEFMRDHLSYFTKETLTTLLQNNGFEIVSCKEIWHDYIISAIVKKRVQNNLSDFSFYQKKIIKEINDFVKKYKNVAIWGAGHQAFALMALANLGGRIKYVIDSAPFKQGKFTPASHIPIVAPDTLLSDPIDAVIIMAGSYSGEIKKILQTKYNKNYNIAIVKNSGMQIIG